jgi:gamma-glutamylcysteine synthetase
MALLVLGGCIWGRDAADEDPSADSKDLGTADEQRQAAVTATKEAAQSIQDYAYAQKDEFIDAAQREFSSIQQEVERLRAAADRSTGTARVDAKAKLEAVNDKLVAAKTQLDQAEAATEDSWEDVKDRYREARSDLTDSFDETRRWLSEQIEP